MPSRTETTTCATHSTTEMKLNLPRIPILPEPLETLVGVIVMAIRMYF